MISLCDITLCIEEISTQSGLNLDEVLCHTFILGEDDSKFLEAQTKSFEVAYNSVGSSWEDTVILLRDVEGVTGKYNEYYIQSGVSLGTNVEHHTYALIVIPTEACGD